MFPLISVTNVEPIANQASSSTEQKYYSFQELLPLSNLNITGGALSLFGVFAFL